MRNLSKIGCMILTIFAAGCSTAPPPPAPDTRAADVQAVKDIEEAWQKVMASKDLDKYASYFADDASALYPGNGILTGKDAIKAVVAPYMADSNFAFSAEATRRMASKGGDMVYTQGTFVMTVTDPKTKKPVTEKGKYLTVFTKQADGSWKAVADTFNSDM
jgi:uncharacterized protein (TIGR02246 family)